MSKENEHLSATAVASPPSKKRSRIVLTVIGLAILVLAVIVVLRVRGAPGMMGPPPKQGPVPVRVVVVDRGAMPITLEALGTVTPIATVTVRSQIAGRLMEIAFHEGQDIKKGDVLAQIDPRPYQAALAQAEGNLARDQATLANAELDLARYEKLIETDSGTRQQRDTQIATVNQTKASLLTDKGAVDSAKLNLSYCRITSPIDGRVGIRKVDVGNYIGVGDSNGIVVITQLHPMSVLFPVSEDVLPQVTKRFKTGAALAVTVYDRSGDIELGTGTIATIDNIVDTSTGTVKIRAMFDNKDETLYPQQFVNVKVLVDTLPDAIVMPTSGIQRGSEGTYVYVVGDDNTVKTRSVKLGPANDGQIAITKGLEVGEKVVIDGADRLRDGAEVNVTATGERPAKEPKPDDTRVDTPRDASADATPQQRMRSRDGGDPPARDSAPNGGP